MEITALELPRPSAVIPATESATPVSPIDDSVSVHGVNEGLRRGGGEGRELRADNKLVVRALARKAIALLKVTARGANYDPVIRTLQQLLAEHYCKERLAKQREAEEARKGIEKLERLDLEAADHHRDKALGRANS
uniref:Uncharacterized protein n=1 Tax=Leersia perrieri TaxID=77586 RepID=A0A0D9X7E3_9ORYZ